MPQFTVCLMACGEDTEAECLAAVAAARHLFEFREVRDVTPATRALNRMIEECQTPYLVPLDADMVVRPGFMRRVSEATAEAESSGLNWHSVLFPLWDTLTCEKIYALKVFRTEVVKRHPYANASCPDIEHYHRLAREGYVSVDRTGEEPIGDHVLHGGFSCYARFRHLYKVHRLNPGDVLPTNYKGGGDLRERARNHYYFFKSKYLETGNRDYLFCIAGMLEGLTAPAEDACKDLGDRSMRHDPGDAMRLFAAWLHGDRRGRIFA